MKDNSTKQDAERSIEQQKSITRCVAVLGRIATPGESPSFFSLLAVFADVSSTSRVAVAPGFCQFLSATIEKGGMANEVHRLVLSSSFHSSALISFTSLQ